MGERHGEGQGRMKKGDGGIQMRRGKGMRNSKGGGTSGGECNGKPLLEGPLWGLAGSPVWAFGESGKPLGAPGSGPMLASFRLLPG